MKSERRKFLKQASLAGAAIAASSTATITETAAATAGATPRAPSAMPKGMLLLTMRGGDRYTLGIKTDKGILDVAAAAKALKSGAPVTMDDARGRRWAFARPRARSGAKTCSSAKPGAMTVRDQSAKSSASG